MLAELEGVLGEREKLSRWLSGVGLSAQAVGFINSQVDRLSEQEGQVLERLWAVEDEIAAVQTVTYNAQEICDQLAEFVRVFATLTDGERKLVVDSLIREVALKHKEVAVTLTPPLAGLGFLSTELAPKEEKRKLPELLIYLAYDLAACCSAGGHGVTQSPGGANLPDAAQAACVRYADRWHHLRHRPGSLRRPGSFGESRMRIPGPKK